MPNYYFIITIIIVALCIMRTILLRVIVARDTDRKSNCAIFIIYIIITIFYLVTFDRVQWLTFCWQRACRRTAQRSCQPRWPTWTGWWKI